MRSVRTAAIAIILVFFVGLFLVLFFASSNRRPTSPAVPSPTEIPTPTVSPTPAETTLDGSILSISDEPVEFKNSLVVTIEREDGSSALLYVTEDTVIENTRGQEVQRTSLREGMDISAIASPSEGGYEATRIQMTTTTPQPTRTVPSATPTVAE